MNIFNKVTLESMKKSRVRTIVTIIGVILSATMITAVITFAFSLQRYLVNCSIQKYGDYHVELYDVSSDFIKEQKQDSKVENVVSFENIGYASISDGKNPNKPYLFIAGFNKDNFNELPINMISGRMPEKKDEIIIPTHLAANGGVKLLEGDTISLDIGRRVKDNKNLNQHNPYILDENLGTEKEVIVSKKTKTYKVVGIYQRPSFEEYSSPGYTLITATDLEKQNDSFSVFIKLKNPFKVNNYVKGINGEYDYVLNDNVLRFIGLSNDNFFNVFLYSVGSILILLIMIGSIFLIYNSFNISLNERIRQFGILSSVGATAKQLRNSVIFEGFLIGAIGIPIGVIVGIGSIDVVIKVISEKFVSVLNSKVPLTINISVVAIIAAFIVSMVTILISAYIPAKKASSRTVLECIRQTSEVKIQSKDIKTSKLAERIYGFDGILALKNFKRNKKRYRSIVLSLTLSIVLFISTSTFGNYLKQITEKSVVNSDNDICFYTQDMDESEVFNLYDKFKKVDGIYSSSYQAMMKYSCLAYSNDFTDNFRKFAGYNLDEELNLPIDIQFVENNKYIKFIEGLGLPEEEYIGKNAKLIAAAKFLKVSDANEKKSELSDMFKNDSMNFIVAPKINDSIDMENKQNINITFVDTIPVEQLPSDTIEENKYTFIVVAPYDLKEKFEAKALKEKIGLTFLSKNSSESVNKMEDIIQSEGITTEYKLNNLNKLFDDNRNTIFVVNVFTYVFIFMISLIAIANVFNTISTNIKLRRRELAMLRSIGMSDRDFKKMMNYECIFYGMRTLFLGIPTALICSYLIYKGLFICGEEITFAFPWESILISSVSVFCVVFITMLYSVSKIKKENIIDALRDDME